MKITLEKNEDGDWERLLFDDKLVYENHRVAGEILMSLLKDKTILERIETEIKYI
jgi:hypothetical protein